MLRDTGACKEFKNGNINIRIPAADLDDFNRDELLVLSDILFWLDCDFIGNTFNLSNYETGNLIYNSYSDCVYIFPWSYLDALHAGRTVKLYARRPDRTDREIIETELF